MALGLVYQIFAKLLSWMVLHARSDTTKEIEILVLNWPCCSDAHPDRGSPGATEL